MLWNKAWTIESKDISASVSGGGGYGSGSLICCVG